MRTGPFFSLFRVKAPIERRPFKSRYLNLASSISGSSSPLSFSSFNLKVTVEKERLGLRRALSKGFASSILVPALLLFQGEDPLKLKPSEEGPFRESAGGLDELGQLAGQGDRATDAV